MKYFFILSITLLVLPLHSMSPFSQPVISATTLAGATAAMLIVPTTGMAELLDNPDSKLSALVAAVSLTTPFAIAYNLQRCGAGSVPWAIAASASAFNVLILASVRNE